MHRINPKKWYSDLVIRELQDKTKEWSQVKHKRQSKIFLQKLKKEGCSSFLAWMSQGFDINLGGLSCKGSSSEKITWKEETKAFSWKR